MRSTNEHSYSKPIRKSVFKMINLARGQEPEIIPFEVIYDERIKKGKLLTRVGKK